mmetsp:Transcript_3418/g.12321  ORF Transcript_3418/g.12321 Transcript_3418/m.12321 type:complete len:341 (-) Transcript_3418:146-1168(-)
MVRKKKAKEAPAAKPFCYYCDRVFEDEAILIQHQKARHFKCYVCNKKLNSLNGMKIHLYQVHREKCDKVPNAKEGRDSLDVEVFGMDGVPAGLRPDAQQDGDRQQAATQHPQAFPPPGSSGSRRPGAGPPGRPPIMNPWQHHPQAPPPGMYPYQPPPMPYHFYPPPQQWHPGGHWQPPPAALVPPSHHQPSAPVAAAAPAAAPTIATATAVPTTTAPTSGVDAATPGPAPPATNSPTAVPPHAVPPPGAPIVPPPGNPPLFPVIQQQPPSANSSTPNGPQIVPKVDNTTQHPPSGGAAPAGVTQVPSNLQLVWCNEEESMEEVRAKRSKYSEDVAAKPSG